MEPDVAETAAIATDAEPEDAKEAAKALGVEEGEGEPAAASTTVDVEPEEDGGEVEPDVANKKEEEEQEGAAEVASMSANRTPSPRPPAIALDPYGDDEEDGHKAQQGGPERGALLLDFPRSPASSPGGGGGAVAGGPASSLPTQESPSSPTWVGPFAESGGLSPPQTPPSRSPRSRSPSPSPHRVGFAATVSSPGRTPPKSPRRHPPLGPSANRQVVETSRGPAYSPSRSRSPRRKSVAEIGQTATPEQPGGGGGGKQTPRGGASGREGRGSRRESSSSRASMRRSSSSSVVSRPGEESGGGGGGGSAGGAGGRGGGRRISAGSMLSVGSNAGDDDNVGSAGAGKPKLRRVESLSSLKGEAEEYGGMSRGRSYTAVDGDADALGQDLAAVVTHLQEVRANRGCGMRLCGYMCSMGQVHLRPDSRGFELRVL